MDTSWIALGSLLVSMTTIVITAINLRSTVRRGYVEQLEKRIDELEKEVARCDAERAALQRENWELMRKLITGGRVGDEGG